MIGQTFSDPAMHQTKKGAYWHFGMKIRAGVDTESGYIHKITATSANIHDTDETAKLISRMTGMPEPSEL